MRRRLTSRLRFSVFWEAGRDNFTNGIHELAKKISRSLLEKVLCLLSNARLDKSFWTERIVYASHLINGLSSTATGGKTPLEVWSGKAA